MKEVPNTVEEKRCHINTTGCRQCNWIGHVVRGDLTLKKQWKAKQKKGNCREGHK